jgi:hypothetical protein
MVWRAMVMRQANSAKRVEQALRLGQPDRVPVVEFLIDERVAAAAVPGCRDVADCMDRLGMDCVCCRAEYGKIREFDDGLFLDEWGVLYKPGREAVS